MTMLYPIVLETEESGAVSAYVPGLPVYAAAETQAKAERAIRAVLAEYLNAHPASRPGAHVRVARVSDRGHRAILPPWRNHPTSWFQLMRMRVPRRRRSRFSRLTIRPTQRISAGGS